MWTRKSLIRHGTVADAEAIEAIHWAGLEGAYLGRLPDWPVQPRVVPERISRWRRWLTDPAIDTIVAESQGTPVGFSTLRPVVEIDSSTAKHGEMPTLYVHPTYWRQGYGRRLCSEILQRAKERGFSSVLLWVVDVNERARFFYESLGFKYDGTSRSDEGSKAPLMARRYGIEVEALHTRMQGGNRG